MKKKSWKKAHTSVTVTMVWDGKIRYRARLEKNENKYSCGWIKISSFVSNFQLGRFTGLKAAVVLGGDRWVLLKCWVTQLQLYICYGKRGHSPEWRELYCRFPNIFQFIDMVSPNTQVKSKFLHVHTVPVSFPHLKLGY